MVAGPYLLDTSTLLWALGSPDRLSALHGLPDLHRDPFDRILLAQAIAEGLALVTNDPQIRRYGVKTLW